MMRVSNHAAARQNQNRELGEASPDAEGSIPEAVTFKGENMPIAKEEIEVECNCGEVIYHDAEIEWQLYCGICKSGICSETHYKKGSNNIFVTVCYECQKQTEKTIEALKDEIRDLKRELKNYGQ